MYMCIHTHTYILTYTHTHTQTEGEADDNTTDHQVRSIHADLVSMSDVNADETEEVNELSQAQCKRLQHQAQTILLWLEMRCSQLTRMIEYFNVNDTHAMKDFYSAHPSLTIENLVTAVCKRARVCYKTFCKWRKQFVLHGQFDRDERGLSQ